MPGEIECGRHRDVHRGLRGERVVHADAQRAVGAWLKSRPAKPARVKVLPVVASTTVVLSRISRPLPVSGWLNVTTGGGPLVMATRLVLFGWVSSTGPVNSNASMCWIDADGPAADVAQAGHLQRLVERKAR